MPNIFPKVSLSDIWLTLFTGHNVYLCSVFDLNFLVLTGTASKDLPHVNNNSLRNSKEERFVLTFTSIISSWCFYWFSSDLIFLARLSPFACLFASECFGLCLIERRNYWTASYMCTRVYVYVFMSLQHRNNNQCFVSNSHQALLCKRRYKKKKYETNTPLEVASVTI